MSAWRILARGVLLAGAFVLPLPGQGSAPEKGAELEVYLMTMGPGDAIWERFGHNAIGIRDRVAGTDLVYNWGVFDFDDADFLPRFLRGEMRYRVEPYDAAMTVEFYRRSNRSVWIQELALTPAERVTLREFVEWNTLEANKYYRYDYFADNCSTRARDALDRALGGLLRGTLAGKGSGLSFRDEARRLADADLLYAGIDVGLGTPSDREMTAHEALFIPMRLREAVREVRRPDASGALGPLVASEREVFLASRGAELPAPRDRRWQFLLVGIALLALMATLARFSPRGERVVAVVWAGFVALVGLLLLMLWGFTRHTWAYANVNLLAFNPLWIAIAVLVARARPLDGRWRGFVAVVALLASTGVVLGVLQWPQRAEQVAALAILPHGWVLARLWRRA
jgi:hypothetical protein